ETADLIAVQLDLARVAPRADLQAERPDRIRDAASAADGARRSVEPGEQAVARGVHVHATEPLELGAGTPIMIGEQLLPTDITDRCRELGRADDVGEQDGGEHRIQTDWRALRAHEPPDRVVHLFEVLDL